VGVGYPNSYTEAMGIQEPHLVYVHLALEDETIVSCLALLAQNSLFTGMILFQELASGQRRGMASLGLLGLLAFTAVFHASLFAKSF